MTTQFNYGDVVQITGQIAVCPYETAIYIGGQFKITQVHKDGYSCHPDDVILGNRTLATFIWPVFCLRLLRPVIKEDYPSLYGDCSFRMDDE